MSHPSRYYRVILKRQPFETGVGAFLKRLCSDGSEEEQVQVFAPKEEHNTETSDRTVTSNESQCHIEERIIATAFREEVTCARAASVLCTWMAASKDHVFIYYDARDDYKSSKVTLL